MTEEGEVTQARIPGITKLILACKDAQRTPPERIPKPKRNKWKHSPFKDIIEAMRELREWVDGNINLGTGEQDSCDFFRTLWKVLFDENVPALISGTRPNSSCVSTVMIGNGDSLQKAMTINGIDTENLPTKYLTLQLIYDPNTLTLITSYD